MTDRTREVVIAITTRMAYVRICLTTGSKGSQLGSSWGLLPSAVIDKLPVSTPEEFASDTGTSQRLRCDVAGHFADAADDV